MNRVHTTRTWIGCLLLIVVTVTLTGPTQAALGAKRQAASKAAAGIWKKVLLHRAQLDKSIQAKKLKDVHHHAFGVRDQVKMLPAQSKSLSPANQAKLLKGVKTITDLAAQLDEAGDGGNQAEAEALNKKFHTVLDAIAGLYPAGALK